MAAVKKWICDGCDDAVETELEADTCSFYQIKVTMGAWGKDLILCTKCHSRMLDKIDPAKWPRFADERPTRAA